MRTLLVSVLMLGVVVVLMGCEEPSKRPPTTTPVTTPTSTKAVTTPTATKAAVTTPTATVKAPGSLVAVTPTGTVRAVAPKGTAVPPVTGKSVEGKTAIRVNCGGPNYTDKNGVVWAADQAYNATRKWGYEAPAGQGGTARHPIDSLDTLYATERWGAKDYRFDVPDGKYTVRLHLAEIYDVVNAPGIRVFTITLQGKPVVENFDATKEAGFGKVTVKEFKDVVVSDGKLVVGFDPVKEFPTIQAIEILGQ